MKGSIGDKQRLLHMIDAIMAIEEYIGTADLEAFKTNSMMRFASVKQIEIIGEAANYLTQAIKNKSSKINWTQIIGMRHILVHEYFGIDSELVWQVIISDLPKLKDELTRVLANI